MDRHGEAHILRTHAAQVCVALAALAAQAPRATAQGLPAGHGSWSASSIQLAGAFAVALWIDAVQTREAARRGYEELNPILGPHPSIGRVNTYTALAGLTVLGAAAAVPARVRPWVLGAALAVETFAIAGNARAGLAVRFP
ncbi:MAG TPA: hypothetical protein VEM13_11655 [Gemmatimonadales bacterium]|nr:hypothetical protein [Gemmatimonadales bacterium]